IRPRWPGRRRIWLRPKLVTPSMRRSGRKRSSWSGSSAAKLTPVSMPAIVTRRRSVARTWHNPGMARTRVSTTVDQDLLASAREACQGLTDAALIDRALAALLARHRAAEIDAAYARYDSVPLDEPDEWGDLASFRSAAGSS